MQVEKFQESNLEVNNEVLTQRKDIMKIETVTESNTQIISKEISETVTETNIIQSEEIETKHNTKVFELISENNFKSEEDDFNFKSKGKYTKELLFNIVKRFENNSNNSNNERLKFGEATGIICEEHLNSCEYIVLEPFSKFKKLKAICNECQSEYMRERKAAGITDWEGCKLYSDIIREFEAKIILIRNGQVSLTNSSSVLNGNEMLYNSIIPLADELIEICKEFYENISNKFDSSYETSNEELIKIKNFIDEIPLGDGVKPLVHKIGDNQELKSKYVKLAIFLLDFEVVKESQSFTGLSNMLKEHINRIVYLRKLIVMQITKWLKFIFGGFYEFVFKSEGLIIDEQFKNSIKIEFSDNNNEEISKIKKFYEAELIKRDAKLIMLEEENLKLKNQLNSWRGDLSFISDKESLITDLKMKLIELEEQYSLGKTSIGNLTLENQKLITQNTSYLKELELIRTECESLKISFERKFTNIVTEITNKYEAQISSFKIELEDWKTKYKNVESQYLSESKQLVVEKESLTSRIQILIQQNNQETNSYKEKISFQITEINNLNITIQSLKQEISFLSQERDNNARTIEQMRIEIQSYTTNVVNITNQYNLIVKARDEMNYKLNDLNNQLNQANSKILHYTNEITILNQKIDVYVNNCNLYSRDNEDLRNQMILLKSDLDKKSAELQNVINIRVSLDNRLGQLENEIRKITEVYQKVTFELNQKLSIISDWEKKYRESEARNQNLQSQLDIYISKIQNIEKIMHNLTEEHKMKYSQLEKLIADLRQKEQEQTILISQRDTEIQKLKVTVNSCKEEWNKLSESYDSLIIDIKNQISINEHLKNKLAELIRRIEIHNQNVTSMDSNVKQQIEILTRQMLNKKIIDLEQDFNKDVIQSKSNIENLKNKLSKIESQKNLKSGIFNNLNISVIENNLKNNAINYDSTKFNNAFQNSSTSTFFASNVSKDGSTRYYSNSGFRMSHVKNENNQALITNLVNKNIVHNVYKASDYQSSEKRDTINNSQIGRMAKSVVKNYVNKSDFFSDNDD